MASVPESSTVALSPFDQFAMQLKDPKFLHVMLWMGHSLTLDEVSRVLGELQTRQSDLILSLGNCLSPENMTIFFEGLSKLPFKIKELILYLQDKTLWNIEDIKNLLNMNGKCSTVQAVSLRKKELFEFDCKELSEIIAVSKTQDNLKTLELIDRDMYFNLLENPDNLDYPSRLEHVKRFLLVEALCENPNHPYFVFPFVIKVEDHILLLQDFLKTAVSENIKKKVARWLRHCNVEKPEDRTVLVKAMPTEIVEDFVDNFLTEQIPLAYGPVLIAMIEEKRPERLKKLAQKSLEGLIANCHNLSKELEAIQFGQLKLGWVDTHLLLNDLRQTDYPYLSCIMVDVSEYTPEDASAFVNFIQALSKDFPNIHTLAITNGKVKVDDVAPLKAVFSFDNPNITTINIDLPQCYHSGADVMSVVSLILNINERISKFIFVDKGLSSLDKKVLHEIVMFVRSKFPKREFIFWSHYSYSELYKSDWTPAQKIEFAEKQLLNANLSPQSVSVPFAPFPLSSADYVKLFQDFIKEYPEIPIGWSLHHIAHHCDLTDVENRLNVVRGFEQPYFEGLLKAKDVDGTEVTSLALGNIHLG